MPTETRTSETKYPAEPFAELQAELRKARRSTVYRAVFSSFYSVLRQPRSDSGSRNSTSASAPPMLVQRHVRRSQIEPQPFQGSLRSDEPQILPTVGLKNTFLAR